MRSSDREDDVHSIALALADAALVLVQGGHRDEATQCQRALAKLAKLHRLAWLSKAIPSGEGA